ncbi:MAG: AMP nucleosidase, partial [Alphaproteobacteria bacterium]|nr:AMP nucleosidase [Alphaproteobacteria bacterium]
MSMSPKPFLPTTPSEAELFADPHQAVARVREIYDANTAYLRERFQEMASGDLPEGRVSAYYPYAAITTEVPTHIDTRLSFGFVPGPGRYVTTLTRPDLFCDYYTKQFELLMKNHKVPVEIGVSSSVIPIHFAFSDGVHVEGQLDMARLAMLRQIFDMPSLADIDDSIANGTYPYLAGEENPLALFTAPRVDYSLHRLRHYTGGDPGHFQNFVIFTNYQFYVDEFLRMGQEIMSKAGDSRQAAYRKSYLKLVEPGGYTTHNANLS